eukprot:TRINITY_DN10483_c0_g1_i5.p1 TRINITY_DN10483_c0_g1~~TRINITY_DN10483_c0_g1_i5.p1  ORF type:complete len:954 (+),score=189.46 TRINITY_DN10483_c0_g1_i5:3058-5919(+)
MVVSSRRMSVPALVFVLLVSVALVSSAPSDVSYDSTSTSALFATTAQQTSTATNMLAYATTNAMNAATTTALHATTTAASATSTANVATTAALNQATTAALNYATTTAASRAATTNWAAFTSTSTADFQSTSTRAAFNSDVSSLTSARHSATTTTAYIAATSTAAVLGTTTSSFPPYSNSFYSPNALPQNVPLVSSNGFFQLVVQGDGKACIYNSQGGPYWCSSVNQAYDTPYSLRLYDSGNLVLENAYGGAVWNSGTSSSYPPCKVTMEDSGQLNLSDSRGSIYYTINRFTPDPIVPTTGIIPNTATSSSSPTTGGDNNATWTVCGTFLETYSLDLNCNYSGRITDIAFASYGTPEGNCPSPSIDPACHADTSLSVVRNACLGRSACSIQASNDVFGDSCVWVHKYLTVIATCSLASNTDTSTTSTTTSANAAATTSYSPTSTTSSTPSDRIVGPAYFSQGRLYSQNGQYFAFVNTSVCVYSFSSHWPLWCNVDYNPRYDVPYTLYIAEAGSLILYDRNYNAIWFNNLFVNGPCSLLMRNDGALVMLDVFGVERWSSFWPTTSSTSTGDVTSSATGRLSSTSSDYTYSSSAATRSTATSSTGQAWDTTSTTSGLSDRLVAPGTLPQFTKLTSQNGNYYAIVNYGNLCTYNYWGSATWCSSSLQSYETPYRLILDLRGNLTLRDGASNAIWSPGTTSRYNPCTLIMQNDGTLVIVDPYGNRVWATGGSTSGFLTTTSQVLPVSFSSISSTSSTSGGSSSLPYASTSSSSSSSTTAPAATVDLSNFVSTAANAYVTSSIDAAVTSALNHASTTATNAASTTLNSAITSALNHVATTAANEGTSSFNQLITSAVHSSTSSGANQAATSSFHHVVTSAINSAAGNSGTPSTASAGSSSSSAVASTTIASSSSPSGSANNNNTVANQVYSAAPRTILDTFSNRIFCLIITLLLALSM